MGTIVNAHTVQRSRELRQLMDQTQHVLHFDPTERDPQTGLSEITRVGWRDASTFAGFCQKHDAETFAPVETRAFDGAPEQCALLAYRSLCYEAHRKRSLQTGDLSGWCSTVLWFSGALSMAASGVVSPNRDLDGLELQNWIGRGSQQESMCLSIVSVQGGGAAVLTWPRQARAPQQFVERLLRDREAVLSLLVQFLFRHVYNIYFSETWWESLRPVQKVFIRSLASLTSTEAYFAPLDFRSRTRVVPWTLARITQLSAQS